MKVGESIISLESYASRKNHIEYLIWVDDDDSKTCSALKNLKKEIFNLRLFVCPRVGFNNMGFMVEHLVKASNGGILLPWADDCRMTTVDWDKKMIRYIDEEVIIGKRTRIGFTKKLLEKHDIIDFYKNRPRTANEGIMYYGRKHNLSRSVLDDPKEWKWFLVRAGTRIEKVSIDIENKDNFDIFKYEVKE